MLEKNQFHISLYQNKLGFEESKSAVIKPMSVSKTKFGTMPDGTW